MSGVALHLYLSLDISPSSLIIFHPTENTVRKYWVLELRASPSLEHAETSHRYVILEFRDFLVLFRDVL